MSTSVWLGLLLIALLAGLAVWSVLTRRAVPAQVSGGRSTTRVRGRTSTHSAPPKTSSRGYFGPPGARPGGMPSTLPGLDPGHPASRGFGGLRDSAPARPGGGLWPPLRSAAPTAKKDEEQEEARKEFSERERSAAARGARLSREAEKTDHAAAGEQLPLAQFMSTYLRGDDLYDDSFSIETPSDDFLGECGVAISEATNGEMGKDVYAIEVWVFDKVDIHTSTRLLFSDHAFHDQEARTRLEPRGEAILASPGGEFTLETASLRLHVRVVDLAYVTGSQPPDRFFERLTLELSVWEHDGSSPAVEDAPQAEEDDLLDEAVDLVREAGKASVSMLQRRLRIGYTRASRLIDLIQERGLAEEADTPRARPGGLPGMRPGTVPGSRPAAAGQPPSKTKTLQTSYSINYTRRIYVTQPFEVRVSIPESAPRLISRLLKEAESASRERQGARADLEFTHRWYPDLGGDGQAKIKVALEFDPQEFQAPVTSQTLLADEGKQAEACFTVKPRAAGRLLLTVTLTYEGVRWEPERDVQVQISVAKDDAGQETRTLTTTRSPAGLQPDASVLAREVLQIDVRSVLNLRPSQLDGVTKVLAVVLTGGYVAWALSSGQIASTADMVTLVSESLGALLAAFGVPLAVDWWTKALPGA